MALDTRIPLSIQHLNLPGLYAAGSQIHAQRGQNKLNELKMQQAQNEVDSRNQLTEWMKAGQTPTDAQVMGLAPETRKSYFDLGKSRLENNKLAREQGLANLEAIGRLADWVEQQPDRQAAHTQVVSMLRQTIPDIQIPDRYNPDDYERFRASSLSVKDQVSQTFEREKFAETERHNRATESTARINATKPPMSVNVNMPGFNESKYAENLGKGMADRDLAALESADRSRNQLTNIQRMEQLLEQIETGRLAPAKAGASALLQGFGMDPTTFNLPADAGPYEAFTAIANEMALGKIGGEDGMPANNFSDADRNFVTSTVPQLDNTESGIRAKLEIGRRMAERSIEREQFILDATQQGLSPVEMRRRWSQHVQQNPLFSAEEKSLYIKQTNVDARFKTREKQYPTPRTQTDFEALPSGATYRDPDDGRLYRKP